MAGPICQGHEPLENMSYGAWHSLRSCVWHIGLLDEHEENYLQYSVSSRQGAILSEPDWGSCSLGDWYHRGKLKRQQWVSCWMQTAQAVCSGCVSHRNMFLSADPKYLIQSLGSLWSSSTVSVNEECHAVKFLAPVTLVKTFRRVLQVLKLNICKASIWHRRNGNFFQNLYWCLVSSWIYFLLKSRFS